MRSLTLAAAAVLALGGAASSTAQAQVKVFGTGLAAHCSKLAVAGESDTHVLSTCTRALQEEPMDTDSAAKTYVNRGIVYLRRSSLTEANRDFDRAQRLMPELGEIYVNRAVVMIKRRQWNDAIRELDKGIALAPDELEKAYFNRALAKEQLDDIRGAYLDFRKALEISPDWEPALTELKRYTVTRPSGPGA